MLGIDLSTVGDATVKKALEGINAEVNALQTGPFAQAAESIKALLDRVDQGGQLVITIELKPAPKPSGNMTSGTLVPVPLPQ